MIFGIARTTNIARIAITASSSTNVNPFLLFNVNVITSGVKLQSFSSTFSLVTSHYF